MLLLEIQSMLGNAAYKKYGGFYIYIYILSKSKAIPVTGCGGL
jgi:hypothetical protein